MNANNYFHKREKYFQCFSLLNVILIFSFLPFSPYVSLVLCFPLLLLLDSSRRNTENIKLFVIILLIILLAYLTASRGIFETAKDDLSDYYKNFLALSRGNLAALFEFGGGIEIGFPFISLLISLIFPYCPPRLFLFLHLVVINTLYMIFLHKFMRDNSVRNSSLFIVVCCLFLGFTGESNLLRQTYSSIFLLFSMTTSDKKNRYIFLTVATIFHFSAIPIFIFFNFLRGMNSKRLFFLLLFLVFFIAAFKILLEPFLEQYKFLKIDAYLNGDGVELSTIITAYKEFVVIILLLSLYSLIGKVDRRLLLILASWLLITGAMEVVLSGISLRINHLVIVFLTGPFLYLAFSKSKEVGLLFAGLLIPLVFFGKVYSFVNNNNDMALFSDKRYFYHYPFEYVSFLCQEIPNDKRQWKVLKYN